MTTATVRPAPWGWLLIVLIVWVAAYASLIPFADTVIALIGLTCETRMGEAVHFFSYKLVEEVARAKGDEIQLEKVEDLKVIMAHGVMSTPGVVIDGKVVHAGGVPARAKVEGWFA